MELDFTTNLHTHTKRCRHARGEDRDYVLKAFECGFTTLGFSDHSPYLFPAGYTSFRMEPFQAEEYVSSISALRDEYAGRIDIKIGFEMENYPRYFRDTVRFVSQLDIDYLILGQHHLKNEHDGANCYTPTLGESDLAMYVDQVIDGMETGIFTYVAHPDNLNYEGELSIYNKHYERLIARAIELDIPLEINLPRACCNKTISPENFFKLCGEMGASVCCGWDAHNPNDLSNPHALSVVGGWIEKYRLKYVKTPKFRKVTAI